MDRSWRCAGRRPSPLLGDDRTIAVLPRGDDLKHKILAIAEEEGVRQAAYALKVLQSQGELTIACTGKNPATGMLVTQAYRVEGPVMLFLTTTAIDVDEELVNRCLVLTINESREQTRLIQERQRAKRRQAGCSAPARQTRCGRCIEMPSACCARSPS